MSGNPHLTFHWWFFEVPLSHLVNRTWPLVWFYGFIKRIPSFVGPYFYLVSLMKIKKIAHIENNIHVLWVIYKTVEDHILRFRGYIWKFYHHFWWSALDVYNGFTVLSKFDIERVIIVLLILPVCQCVSEWGEVVMIGYLMSKRDGDCQSLDVIGQGGMGLEKWRKKQDVICLWPLI